jgi:uncharacterized membrane protein YfcA
MTGAEALFVLLAGLGAGTVNSVVGSGGLITFPVLLATGMPPVTANVTNTVGVLPGAVFGAIGYRRELVGQRRRLIRLGSASLVGGVVGSVLLLALPSTAFEAVVPWLIVGAVALVLLQPALSRSLREGRHTHASADGGILLWLCILATGVYGGYFGAAQGVILLGVMGVLLADDLQRINATKNVLAFVANGVAALLFIVFAYDHVEWAAVALLALGSAIGGTVGSRYGRRLPEPALRALIVVVGLAAAVQVLTNS